MAMITETMAQLGKAACLDPETEFGHDVVMPNRMAINASKYTFASNFHRMCQHLQDIAGGLSTTGPTFRDWNNPEIRPYINKYLSAKDGVPTEDRLRVMRLVKDMTCNFYQIDTIHGKGVHGCAGDVLIRQRRLEKAEIRRPKGSPRERLAERPRLRKAAEPQGASQNAPGGRILPEHTHNGEKEIAGTDCACCKIYFPKASYVIGGNFIYSRH